MNIKSIRRDEIRDDRPEDLVALFPSGEKGVEFITKYNIWGFVNIQRTPTYFALYIGGDIQKIKHFAEVDRITTAKDADLPDDIEKNENYDPEKKVISFKNDLLYVLEDPIPYKNRVLYPPVRYTSLQNFRDAESMDDLF